MPSKKSLRLIEYTNFLRD